MHNSVSGARTGSSGGRVPVLDALSLPSARNMHTQKHTNKVVLMEEQEPRQKGEICEIPEEMAEIQTLLNSNTHTGKGYTITCNNYLRIYKYIYTCISDRP